MLRLSCFPCVQMSPAADDAGLVISQLVDRPGGTEVQPQDGCCLPSSSSNGPQMNLEL